MFAHCTRSAMKTSPLLSKYFVQKTHLPACHLPLPVLNTFKKRNLDKFYTQKQFVISLATKVLTLHLLF